MAKIIGENLKKKDAAELAKWWNANTKDYHFVIKMDNSKYYKVVRQ
jgi:hypothetical protein